MTIWTRTPGSIASRPLRARQRRGSRRWKRRPPPSKSTSSSLRSERQVADVNHNSVEELTKAKFNDMSGCIQDRVEDRLSALHQTSHAQIEKGNVRVDAADVALGVVESQVARLESRSAQLGVVTSWQRRGRFQSAATTDIQLLSTQGDVVLRRLREQIRHQRRRGPG